MIWYIPGIQLSAPAPFAPRCSSAMLAVAPAKVGKN